jgi:hypothetical protein
MDKKMFIHISDFYHNTESIYGPVILLDYQPCLHGYEVLDFYMVPQGIENGFADITGRKIKITKKSGVFRRPYPIIHFENFDQNSFFVGAVALEKTTFQTHRHKETGITSVTSVQDNLEEFVKNNCFSKEKWDTVANINLKAGDLVLFKPWLWHSFEDKLIKVFYLEVDKCESAETVKPAVKDGSSEMPTE